MKKFLLNALIATLILLLIPQSAFAQNIWNIQSIDTMKFSRDASRNPIINKIIPIHIKAIADMGANYAALDTPYDDEFIPVLKKWVNETRKHKMNVWFRGNFSGWEGWFEYPKLKSTDEHIAKTYRFITQNPQLFADGDIFTPAPEPENGIMGDPRRTRKFDEFNKFLSDSYVNCMNAFAQINKKVNCGVWSMNTDVLRETVYKDTIKKMGGIVSIDHYTNTPEKLITDVKNIAKQFGAKVVLGEFGAPIPDINGNMTEIQQRDYIEGVLKHIYENKDIVYGANYWVIAGGSTTLLRDNNTPKLAVTSIQKYFKPIVISGKVTDEFLKPLDEVIIESSNKLHKVKTDAKGEFKIAVPYVGESITINSSKSTFNKHSQEIKLSRTTQAPVQITLTPTKKDWIYNLRNLLKKTIGK